MLKRQKKVRGEPPYLLKCYFLHLASEVESNPWITRKPATAPPNFTPGFLMVAEDLKKGHNPQSKKMIFFKMLIQYSF